MPRYSQHGLETSSKYIKMKPCLQMSANNLQKEAAQAHWVLIGMIWSAFAFYSIGTFPSFLLVLRASLISEIRDNTTERMAWVQLGVRAFNIWQSSWGPRIIDEKTVFLARLLSLNMRHHKRIFGRKWVSFLLGLFHFLLYWTIIP